MPFIVAQVSPSVVASGRLPPVTVAVERPDPVIAISEPGATGPPSARLPSEEMYGIATGWLKLAGSSLNPEIDRYRTPPLFVGTMVCRNERMVCPICPTGGVVNIALVKGASMDGTGCTMVFRVFTR